MGCDGGVDLREVERSIERLAGVAGVRLVCDGETSVGAEIVSDGTKPAIQLVRDVQSVALALHDLELDHGAVVVTHGEPPTSAEDTPARPALADVAVEGISTHVSGEEVRVECVLALDGRRATGTAAGPPTPGNRWRLVGRAACQAAEQLLGIGGRLAVEAVEVVSPGGIRVAVAVLTTVQDGCVVRQTGSAVCLLGDDDAAVVRAVIDATHGRIPVV